MNLAGVGDGYQEHAVVYVPDLAVFYGPLLTPDPATEPAEHIASSYITYYHGVGTCRIGPAGDPGAVVDPHLGVHGVEGLWVADASVLPTFPHANRCLAVLPGAAHRAARSGAPDDRQPERGRHRRGPIAVPATAPRVRHDGRRRH
ncbi:MAG: GMC family oxidoreductase, partial [Candidatus Limnocylindrales bacterium]